MSAQLKDNALFQNFVSPHLCQELYAQGLYFNVKFFWQVKENDLQLITKAFDPDGYYEEAMPLIEKASPTLQIIPAYSLKDVENVVPNYLLRQHNGDYILQMQQCSICHGNAVQVNVQDERMPDAFAKLLLDCVTNDVVSLDKVNYAMAHTA